MYLPLTKTISHEPYIHKYKGQGCFENKQDSATVDQGSPPWL